MVFHVTPSIDPSIPAGAADDQAVVWYPVNLFDWIDAAATVSGPQFALMLNLGHRPYPVQVRTPARTGKIMDPIATPHRIGVASRLGCDARNELAPMKTTKEKITS